MWRETQGGIIIEGKCTMGGRERSKHMNVVRKMMVSPAQLLLSNPASAQVSRWPYFNPLFERTHVIHPRDVSRDPGEDCGLPGDITALAGHKAGHSLDSILTIHQAVEGASRITLQEIKAESWNSRYFDLWALAFAYTLPTPISVKFCTVLKLQFNSPLSS